MSSTGLTLFGAYNALSGVISIPSSFPGGPTLTGTNYVLQQYLTNLANSYEGFNSGFINNDISAGVVFSDSFGSQTFEEFTNVNSYGVVTGGIVNGAYSVASAVTDVLVQAPGNETLFASGAVTTALFGANSNVDYNVLNGKGAVYLAGGNDFVSALSTTSTNAAFYSAGNDTLSLNGIDANDTVSAQGNATTRVYLGGSDAATVVASDNAIASVVFYQRAGGNLDFINNSSEVQTIYSGSYTVAGGASVYAPNAVTAWGGQGGGFFVGGRAGDNSLVGGNGLVTLVGGGSSDLLEASGYSSTAYNYLFAGPGTGDSLLASASSHNNAFSLGLIDVGVGVVTSAAGIASTAGSGNQVFFIGNLASETLFGSTVVGATNLYDVIGNATAGGSNFTIENFGANSAIYLVNNQLQQGGSDASIASVLGAVGGSAQIVLSDGTTITLAGVSSSHLTLQGGGDSILYH